MIAFANTGNPRSFNDFTKLTVGKGTLSSATVSKRLKELVAIKIFEESIIRSPTGRKIVGYTTTERGRRILEIAKELEVAIKSSKKVK